MVIVSGRAIKCPSAFLFLRFQSAPLFACLGDIATGATLYKVGQHHSPISYTQCSLRQHCVCVFFQMSNDLKILNVILVKMPIDKIQNI